MYIYTEKFCIGSIYVVQYLRLGLFHGAPIFIKLKTSAVDIFTRAVNSLDLKIFLVQFHVHSSVLLKSYFLVDSTAMENLFMITLCEGVIIFCDGDIIIVIEI